MKLWKLLYAFLVLQCIAQNLYPQNPEWITYTAGDNATCIAEEGNYIWAGINKDLVRLHKITGEKIFFNKANSGLPANDYSAIAIDKQGNKWIGTSQGIVKYNGTTWQVFNKTNSGFPGGTIKSICVDTKNTKWIAVSNIGLVKFNDTVWTIYNAANTGNVLGTIRAMCTDKKNNKWFATSNGVVKFNDSIWSRHPRYGFNGGSTEVLTIAVDSLGWVWSADINSYIAKFQNNGADSVWVLVKKISFSNWAFTYPISMAVDKNGYCWVGYLSGVIVKANVDGRSDYNLANPIKTQNSVNAIHIDKEGNTWFASGYSGLVKYDSVNWISYKTTASGLPSNTVGSITIDNNGDKWIGSDDGGVAKFDNTVWSKFDTANHIIPSNKIIAIAVDKKNKKWIAAGSGYIYQYNDTSWKIIQYPDNLNGLVIDEAQNKWIATYSNGLLKYDGTTWIKYYPPFSGTIPPGVYCMVIDRQGEIWGRIYTQSTGYNPGLGRFNGTDWTIFSQANSGLPENYFTHIAVSKNNNKWITGGQNPFLVEFDGAKWIRYDSSNFNLPSFKISSIAFEENGNMWIATESGLCKFDGNIIKIFNTGNSGIPLDKVLNISIDAKGNKWIGTNGGGLAVFREGGIILGTADNHAEIIDKEFLLFQNYPNPFNPVTKIEYRVPENSVVSLKVFDVLGKEVATLVNKEHNPGKYSIMFNGTNLGSGVYFYRLQVGRYAEVKKLLLVK